MSFFGNIFHRTPPPPAEGFNAAHIEYVFAVHSFHAGIVRVLRSKRSDFIRARDTIPTIRGPVRSLASDVEALVKYMTDFLSRMKILLTRAHEAAQNAHAQIADWETLDGDANFKSNLLLEFHDMTRQLEIALRGLAVQEESLRLFASRVVGFTIDPVRENAKTWFVALEKNLNPALTNAPNFADKAKRILEEWKTHMLSRKVQLTSSELSVYHLRKDGDEHLPDIRPEDVALSPLPSWARR